MIEKGELLAMSNDRLRRMATYASISVATVLIVGKLVAYLMTDSVVMLSSLLDSTIDLISSAVTAYGVASALRPPDADHRFGHGKAEPLAALAQAAFIVGSSVLLGYEALSRIYHPHDIQNLAVGYWIMGGAIILTVALVAFQHLVVHRTSSIAIHADRLHYIGDVAINLAVILAFVLHQWTHWDGFDPLFALLIAGGLGFGAYHIAHQALNSLMDRELPDEQRDRIKAIVAANPHVKGLHDMRTRSDSDRIFIEVHVEMDSQTSLSAAHIINEALMAAITSEFPNADVLIHPDPEGIEEDRLDTQIARREAMG